MSKKELKGAKVLPIKPEDYYDEPTRALTEYDGDINVKNRIIWINIIIFKMLNLDIFKKSMR